MNSQLVPQEEIYRDEIKDEHGADSPGFRPPPKTVSIVRRNESETLMFQRWILSIFSIISILLTPIIIYMGLQARIYGLSKIAFDNALITIGLLLFIINCITVYATITFKKKILLSIIYSYVVLLMFLIIYTVAIFSFSPDMQEYFYDNWDWVRDHVAHINYEDFKANLREQIIALGIFNICIMICITLSVAAIVALVSVEKVIRTLLPPLNLMMVVLSISLIMTGIYSGINSEFMPVPGWMNFLTVTGGLFMMFSGFFGYYATLKNQKRHLKAYVVILGIILFFVILTAVGYFVFSFHVGAIIDQKWTEISPKLVAKGYNLTKRDFYDHTILVLKFTGLYGLIFAIFIILTIAAALAKILNPSI